MVNALSAVHKKQSERFELYKLTVDVAHLGGFNITSFKQYKDCLDILLAFTKDRAKDEPPKAPGKPSKILAGENEVEEDSIFTLMEKKKELEGAK